MSKWLIEKLFVGVFALLFSQMPFFMQEYEQRLSGHVDELRQQLGALQRMAQESNKSLEEYITKLAVNPDPDISKQGGFIEAMRRRHAHLSDAIAQIQGASVFSKPFVFTRHLDLKISKSTLLNFKPGVLVTLEGLVYVFVGMAVGYTLFGLFHFVVRNRYQRDQN